ncbi:MAG: hypothetical protein ACTSQE_06865 [Candidatus Heimdallarchaeaceae archaeon]
MAKPIIEINDFKGGMTLSSKMGRSDQFKIGEGLDFSSRPGKLAPGTAWSAMTLTGTSTIPTGFNAMVDARKGGYMWFAGKDTKIYYKNAISTILLSTDSDQTGEIRDMEEFDERLVFIQDTTLGIKDLTAGLTAGYTFNFKTGFQNKTYHPIHLAADNNIYIGNGQYVGKATTLDTSTDVSVNALDLVDNWNVRALSDFGYRYLAVGANYGSETKPSKAKIFLWDREASSWNDEIAIPESEIKATIYTAGFLWVWAGKSCNLYVVPESSRTATKMFSFGREDPQLSHEVYPKAVVARKGTIYFALSRVKEASSARNPAAIYSFPADPNKFTLNLIKQETGYDDYFYSLAAKPESYGELYASYYDGTKYYLERENISTNEAYYKDTGTYESFTYSAPAGQQIVAEKFGIEFDPFISTHTGDIALYYKKDNDANWTELIDVDANISKVYEATVRKYLRCSSLKLKVTIRGASSSTYASERPFISRIYVLGGLTSKP